MYGKIFSSMYSGSLYGQWQAIVTFQQLIVLADKDGTVDMTPQAIAAMTSIPLEIIQAGIETLEAPDKYSRSPNEEGRRIVRIDPDRPWGWHIVNYSKYREIRSSEERREYHKQYWHKRKQTQPDSTDTQQDSTNSTKAVSISSKQKEYIELPGQVETIAPDAFILFWTAYPKKRSRGKAIQAWKKLRPNAELQERIMEALKLAKASDDWCKDNVKFIPYPATWLNAQGWEDEFNSSSQPASIFKGGK